MSARRGVDGRRRRYLAETDDLLRELKLELTELRVGHQRLNEQSQRMSEELSSIRVQRDGLVQERHNLVLSAGTMKEQLFEMQMENQRLLQRIHKLEKENDKLKGGKGMDSGGDQVTSSDDSILMAQRDVRDMEMKYSNTKARVEMLRVEISKLEMEKSMAEHQFEMKSAALNQKMASLKRACMDKDSMINSMRGEKSKILMCLWKATYGNTSNNTDAPAQLFYSRTKDLPVAAVEPYNRAANTLACVSHCLKFEHPVPFQHPDVLRNKTMTLEFELYRERKMAELIASDFSLFSDYTTSMDDVRPASESTPEKRDVFGTISTHTISSCYSSVTVESG